MTASKTPQLQYEQRLETLAQLTRQCERQSDQLSNGRLAVFVVIAALGFSAWYGLSSWYWLLGPGLIFLGLVLKHRRVRRAHQRHLAVSAEYEAGLRRLAGKWPGHGPEGTNLAPPDHPYAADLDLFGKGSLFQLLCTARTPFGQRVLAEWLLSPADPDTAAARQKGAEELRENISLREDIAALAPAAQHTAGEARLATWGLGSARFSGTSFAVIAWGLSILAIIGFFLLLQGVLALMVFCLTLGIIAFAWHRETLVRLGESVDSLSRELNLLAQILARFEQETPHAPLLRQQRERLHAHGEGASRAIARLDRLTVMYHMLRNPMFAPIGLCIGWNFQIARHLEKWRARHGRDLAQWLDAVGTWEALLAFSVYRYEWPEDCHAEISPGKAHFQVEGLGHPLMHPRECVRNDVTFHERVQVLLVSGSNMSGKSTLLRSVGLAALMAQVGLPVRATALRMSSLQIGATLRVQDSLLEGASRFYAELRRLQAITQLAENDAPPLLFLCDEILHGTNSHDRCIGAAALIRALMERGAIGLVTTHDLALTQLAEEASGLVENVHLQDEHEDGALRFDYKLRPGVVQHSNALELMRSLGLPV